MYRRWSGPLGPDKERTIFEYFQTTVSLCLRCGGFHANRGRLRWFARGFPNSSLVLAVRERQAAFSLTAG